MKPAPESIAIWGAGGHGHVVADLLKTAGPWNLAGFVDNVNPPGSTVVGLPVLGDQDVLPELLLRGISSIVVAVGNCGARARMLERVRALGFKTPSVVHPSCILYPSATLGHACVLCAGAVVGAQSVVEDGVILNTHSSVDHDSRIGFCSHVAPGAILCGSIAVGRETWIGAGAVVRDHLSIGDRVMVGAGAVVLKNVPDGQTVYGNPARPKPQPNK